MRRRVRRLVAPGAVLALLAAALGAAWGGARSWAPDRASYRYQGFVAAPSDGSFDWAAVRSGGADFVYLTATRGSTARDPRFAATWSALYAADVRRGAVHIYSLCHLASDQARNFAGTVPRVGDALPPAIALDFHADCPARPERRVVIGEIGRLAALMAAASGKRPLLKVSARFEASYQVTAALDLPYWAEGNFFPPAYASRPWKLWQANDMRRVAGAPAAVGWSVVAQ